MCSFGFSIEFGQHFQRSAFTINETHVMQRKFCLKAGCRSLCWVIVNFRHSFFGHVVCGVWLCHENYFIKQIIVVRYQLEIKQFIFAIVLFLAPYHSYPFSCPSLSCQLWNSSNSHQAVAFFLSALFIFHTLYIWLSNNSSLRAFKHIVCANYCYLFICLFRPCLFDVNSFYYLLMFFFSLQKSHTIHQNGKL